MMDPFSITVACFTLIATISKVSYSLLEFSQGFRDAKGDLNAIQSELRSFGSIIEIIWQQYTKFDEDLALQRLIQQIIDTLSDCNNVINDIETCLEKHSHSVLGKSGFWTLGGGKNDMAEHRARLEAHKSRLIILLVMLNIYITREPNKETAQMHSTPRRAAGLEMQPSKYVAKNGRTSSKPSVNKWLEDTSYHTVSASSSFGDASLFDHEEDDENYEAVIGSASSASQRGHSRALPILSMPSLEDAWDYSPISFPTSYYDDISSSSDIYDWPTSSSSNINSALSGSSVFIKLTRWTDGSLSRPSLGFETICRWLPKNLPTLRLRRFCAKRPQKSNYAYFNCATVSRDHCEVHRNSNGDWYIKDLGSLAGTFLNSRRLSGPGTMSELAFLREGDVIELGLLVKMTISFFVG